MENQSKGQPYMLPKDFYPDLSSEEREGLQKQIVENMYAVFEEMEPLEIIEHFKIKIPEHFFSDSLENIHNACLNEANRLIKENPELVDFLEKYPVPIMMEDFLSLQTRVYFLLINEMREWILKQQRQIELLFLGTGYKRRLTKTFEHCLISGEAINKDKVFLEYGIKDGRLPLPISFRGHEMIEEAKKSDNESEHPIERHRLKISKKYTWRQLYNGSLIEMGFNLEIPRGPEAAKVARRVHKDTGFEYQEIVDWLKETNRI